jgi:hypothetical protein
MAGEWQSTVVPPRSGRAWRLGAGQPDGRLEIGPPVSASGQSMTFAAERDVLVAVTSCAAPGANAGGARPIRVDVSG